MKKIMKLTILFSCFSILCTTNSFGMFLDSDSCYSSSHVSTKKYVEQKLKANFSYEVDEEKLRDLVNDFSYNDFEALFCLVASKNKIAKTVVEEYLSDWDFLNSLSYQTIENFKVAVVDFCSSNQQSKKEFIEILNSQSLVRSIFKEYLPNFFDIRNDL